MTITIYSFDFLGGGRWRRSRRCPPPPPRLCTRLISVRFSDGGPLPLTLARQSRSMRSKKLPGCSRVKVSHARWREAAPSLLFLSLLLADKIGCRDIPKRPSWPDGMADAAHAADAARCCETYVTANCVCVAGICNFFFVPSSESKWTHRRTLASWPGTLIPQTP